jgi:hypothetical protein
VAVVVVHQGPTLTQDRYEAAVRRLTGGKERLESLSDWPVGGIIFHTAGEAPGGFRVVDVWESEEAFTAFGEHLGPIMGELGVEEQPEMYPAHTFVSS